MEHLFHYLVAQIVNKLQYPCCTLHTAQITHKILIFVKKCASTIKFIEAIEDVRYTVYAHVFFTSAHTSQAKTP